MEPEPLRTYVISEGPPPPHIHDYQYVAGEHVVRHCECGKSWVLVVLESLIDRSISYQWREIEEDVASDATGQH